ncbi:MBL fold metallo-hydrolase [Natrialbaceae archaeon AArc-T1-2]|uniref:MBL fold metallo-hydrolase n=1 Tax=Natrialbaceae archaeon AArc-T1-2 TaxID=3053904 RepID=UPI00255A71CA|nr:MBL fold metallo-hydrolase [Natrialbaceae archaeon AArc-T1-2]WIV68721.1 MBL fold metallo-hydrolase [Natrialbaceae archaeon AArc-T1-2]
MYLVDTMLAETSGFCASFFIDREQRMLIDAGSATTVDEILDALATLDVDPATIEYLVVTHLHLDHAGGAGRLVEICKNATVLCHPLTATYLTDEAKLTDLVESSHAAVGEMASAYDASGTVPEGRIETVEDGDKIDLGDTVVDVIPADGHAPHHFSLYDRAADALFLIDEGAVHIHGHSMPNASPPNFDLEKTVESLERFQEYETATLLYCHFGVSHDASEQLAEDIDIVERWVDEIETEWKRHGDEAAVLEAQLEKHGKDIEQPAVRAAMKMHIRGVLIYLQQRETA